MQNELGKTLEALRKAKKLSLRAVADITELNFSYIRDLELNVNRSSKKTVKPTTDTLQKLATAYDYPLENLLKLAGQVEVANAFEKILNDPDVNEKKKEAVRILMEMDDNAESLDRVIGILNALK
ncbi:helix-turn-helix domain-containing protein [Brevibacillus sp. DP1.3A]|uniref:helix-turn-helix domain-containing protein n=1 Tax=Brevibacillus sp. DP1.3A TaxID=2738867 RepID=UPI00156B0903|nr:helix-turn-helix transcriptional regulator [Brevibacillus sp. DP1.3A]UED76072.1 helix-turn-helix domain-containing protein [Brevibacillus sp. DP1.3A]